MNDVNNIFTIKEYGKIVLKLKKYMDERSITRNRLSRMINTRFEVIDKWYNNKVEVMDLDVLARICYALKCNVSDILEYEVNENSD